MQYISDHITYKEATKSITARRHGIDNTPTEEHLLNMGFVAVTIFEPLRNALGGFPIGVSSFYRAPILNEKIGGSDSSQHCNGEAIDIDADTFGYHTNKELFEWILHNCNFDQLIWEHGDSNEPEWVHVSKTKEENRGEVLVAYRQNGDLKYRYYETNT